MYSGFTSACALSTGVSDIGGNSIGGSRFLGIPIRPEMNVRTSYGCPSGPSPPAVTDRSDAPMLGPVLLAELEQRWRGQRMSLVDLLQPGLSPEEIEAATAPLGLQLPLEAQRWWQWHDGVPAHRVRFARERVIAGSGFEYLPLAEAVQQYENMRRLAADLERDDALAGRSQDDWWDRGWFPITVAANGRVVACDCGVPLGSVTPIRSVKWGHDETWHHPRAASFGQMITWWLEAFDDGAYEYNSTDGTWQYHWEVLAPERELTTLV